MEEIMFCKKTFFGTRLFQNMRQKKAGNFFTASALPLFLNLKYAGRKNTLNLKKVWFF